MPRDAYRTVVTVRTLAAKLGFTCTLLKEGNRTGLLTITRGTTAAPVEVNFLRENPADSWHWARAIHRVHWTDPIAKANGGQPELDTFKAFKAYLSLLSVTLR